MAGRTLSRFLQRSAERNVPWATLSINFMFHLKADSSFSLEVLRMLISLKTLDGVPTYQEATGTF
jgi:hypothetical protein